MWECRDLFALGERHVLISCPRALAPGERDYRNLYQCGWLAGRFDGTHFEHGAFHELDRGFEFYAPQTTQDSQGRRLLFGWLGLPEENEMSQPTIPYGWIHQMSCPAGAVLAGRLALPAAGGGRFRPSKGALTRFEGGELPALAIDSAWLDLAPSGEGRLGFGPWPSWCGSRGASCCVARTGRAGVGGAILPLAWGSITVLCDRSSLECFVDGGRQTLSTRYFPGENPVLSARCDGDDSKICLYHWPLAACPVQ